MAVPGALLHQAGGISCVPEPPKDGRVSGHPLRTLPLKKASKTSNSSAGSALNAVRQGHCAVGAGSAGVVGCRIPFKALAFCGDAIDDLYQSLVEQGGLSKVTMYDTIVEQSCEQLARVATRVLRAEHAVADIMLFSKTDSDERWHRKCKELAIAEDDALALVVDAVDSSSLRALETSEFTVNLAICNKHGEIEEGYVYHTQSRTLYCASKGNGAFRVNERGVAEKIGFLEEPREIRNVVVSPSRSASDDEELRRLYPGASMLELGAALKWIRIAEGTADLYPRAHGAKDR